MDKQRNDDIFNPEYKKEKSFLRKENRKKIFFICLFVSLFLYGSLDFIYEHTIKVEIRDIFGRRVEIINLNNEYYICEIRNKSPFSIKLKIESNIDYFTNYNNDVIGSNRNYWIWFTTNETGYIKILGDK